MKELFFAIAIVAIAFPLLAVWCMLCVCFLNYLRDALGLR
jgi:hypothetical protein